MAVARWLHQDQCAPVECDGGLDEAVPRTVGDCLLRRPRGDRFDGRRHPAADGRHDHAWAHREHQGPALLHAGGDVRCRLHSAGSVQDANRQRHHGQQWWPEERGRGLVKGRARRLPRVLLPRRGRSMAEHWFVGRCRGQCMAVLRRCHRRGGVGLAGRSSSGWGTRRVRFEGGSVCHGRGESRRRCHDCLAALIDLWSGGR